MSILSATILLFLVMDPLGNLPVFAVVLGKVPPERRRRVLLRELLYALAILLAFLAVGPWLLSLLAISKPALGIAGGLILFVIAILMVFPIEGYGFVGKPGEHEPFIVPLAVPLIAGPSAMSALLLLSSSNPGRFVEWLVALVLAWLVTAIILLFGGALQRLLGPRGLIAMERLMGMILIVLAVQMFLDGVKAFMAGG